MKNWVSNILITSALHNNTYKLWNSEYANYSEI